AGETSAAVHLLDLLGERQGADEVVEARLDGRRGVAAEGRVRELVGEDVAAGGLRGRQQALRERVDGGRARAGGGEARAREEVVGAAGADRVRGLGAQTGN